MKRSLSGLRGSFASNRISSKKRVETMSAADKHVVGWPVPASLVDLTESIRSCAAMFLRAERDVLMVKVTNRGRQPSHVMPVRNPRPDESGSVSPDHGGTHGQEVVRRQRPVGRG